MSNILFNLMVYKELTESYSFEKYLCKSLNNNQIRIYERFIKLMINFNLQNKVGIEEINDKKYFYIDFPYSTNYEYFNCSKKTLIDTVKKLEKLELIKRSVGGLKSGASRIFFPVIFPFFDYENEVDEIYQRAKYSLDQLTMNTNNDLRVSTAHHNKQANYQTEVRERLIKQMINLNKHFNVTFDYKLNNEEPEALFIKKLLADDYAPIDIEEAINKVYKLSTATRTSVLVVRELRNIKNNKSKNINVMETENNEVVEVVETIENNTYDTTGIFS